MLVQGVVIENQKLLMVNQLTSRGKIIWNLPGGHIENMETPEDACRREFLEETGFIVEVGELIHQSEKKYSFACHVIGGSIPSEHTDPDIFAVDWIPLHDQRIDLKIKEVLSENHFQ